MAEITLELIKELREKTGLGMMDCKKALFETDGDIERAIVLLRKKGLAVAQKRADKATSCGIVESYIHPGNTLGVLLEIDCETDFVASTQDLKEFAKNVCMQIAALKPLCVSPDQLDPAFIEREKDIATEQLKQSGKPANVIEKILVGKLEKIYTEVCLIKQAYIKDDKHSVEEVLNSIIAKVGEKIVIKRFARFQVGVHE